MSYTYGFFDAVDLGSGNYDRVYSSAEFSHYWALLVGDGVFGQPSTSLNVLAATPVAMSVKVAPGTGWIKGHYLTVPDNMDEVIAIPVANPSLPRIDSIIMALNNTDRDMKLYVRSGTAAASPKAVTLQRDADVWELELAQITVAAGAGNITQQAIKDMRADPNRCGIVTGLIDQFDISGFLTAAQASFDEWFEDVKSQLGDDVAGNLLNLIQGLQESKLDVSAKASTPEATTGTNDTKYMTPLKTKQAVDKATSGLWAVGDIKVSGRDLETLTNGEYLSCDGRALSSSTYRALYNAIGVKFGTPITQSTVNYEPSTSQRSRSMGPYAFNNLGGTPTQGVCAPKGYSTNHVVVTSLTGITRTLSLGSDNYRPLFVFYIGSQAYVLVYNSSSDKIFLYTVGTSLSQIWTLDMRASPTFGGAVLIGSTMYLAITYGYTNSSPPWTCGILAVTGTSCSWTVAYTATSNLSSAPQVVMMGNYLYLGAPVNRRTRVNSISMASYTNATLTQFFNLLNNYSGNIRGVSPDFRHLVAYFSDSGAPSPIGVLTVDSGDSAFTYRAVALDRGQWREDTETWRVLDVKVDNKGIVTAITTKSYRDIYWGVETDGILFLTNTIALSTRDDIQPCSYFNISSPYYGYVLYEKDDPDQSDNWSFGSLVIVKNPLTQFNLPNSTVYATGSPNKEYIHAKEVS